MAVAVKYAELIKLALVIDPPLVPPYRLPIKYGAEMFPELVKLFAVRLFASTFPDMTVPVAIKLIVFVLINVLQILNIIPHCHC